MKKLESKGKSPQEKNKIQPKKRLGQNFLSETGIIQKLVLAAAIKPGDTILEIGPGTGNLTAELAKSGNRIIGIEKDPDMVAAAKDRFKDFGNVEISAGDALAYDETKISRPYKVAANLPFYLTAPLIRKLLESSNPPESLTIIVQKEVAQRIAAKPPEMSLLGISVQFYAKTQIVATVPRGCFWPAPKVDCAIISIVPYIKEGDRFEKKFIGHFFETVKAGFLHPRKQLANNLAQGLKMEKTATKKLLKESGIAPERRPETLTTAEWEALTQARQIDYN